MDQKYLGPMVRFHRKKAQLTQQELGRLAGVGKTVVFDIEKGKESIRLNSLLKILYVLNIKIEFHGPLMAIFKEQADEKS